MLAGQQQDRPEPLRAAGGAPPPASRRARASCGRSAARGRTRSRRTSSGTRSTGTAARTCASVRPNRARVSRARRRGERPRAAPPPPATAARRSPPASARAAAGARARSTSRGPRRTAHRRAGGRTAAASSSSANVSAGSGRRTRAVAVARDRRAPSRAESVTAGHRRVGLRRAQLLQEPGQRARRLGRRPLRRAAGQERRAGRPRPRAGTRRPSPRGRPATAMAVFTSTASAPSSIASAACDGAPRPASTTTGTVACSTMIRTASRVRTPWFEPIHDPSGMTVAQPASSSRLARTGSALMYGQHREAVGHQQLGGPQRLDRVGQQVARLGRDLELDPRRAARRRAPGGRGAPPRRRPPPRGCSAAAGTGRRR